MGEKKHEAWKGKKQKERSIKEAQDLERPDEGKAWPNEVAVGGRKRGKVVGRKKTSSRPDTLS